LPTAVEALTRLKSGLVLVGGPTGSGKTTTVAALVDAINRRDAKHIITIEDPIEYDHAHQRSIVEQVEIGVDAPDFPTALRSAVRQSPDVIVVGEMRDPETMRIALAAGETGHLVFSTVHTSDVASHRCRIRWSARDRRPIRQNSDGACRGDDSISAAENWRWPVPAVELLMVDTARAAHSQERAAAPASGDDDYAEGRVVHH
jgi:twitching motility protein PilT